MSKYAPDSPPDNEPAACDGCGIDPADCECPAMCSCGHAMADHMEGFDCCTLCGCEAFQDADDPEDRDYSVSLGGEVH